MPGARHGTAWPKVTRRVGGRGGTPARPRRQQRGGAALPSRCPRFAPALFPLQTLRLPPICPPRPRQMSPPAASGPPTAACATASAAWPAGSCQGRARAAGFGGTDPPSPLPKPRAPRLLGLPSRGSFPTSPAAAVPWRLEPWGAGAAHTCAGTPALPASLDAPPSPGFPGRGAEGVPSLSPPPRRRLRGCWQLTPPRGLGRASQATSWGEAVPVVPPNPCPRWPQPRPPHPLLRVTVRGQWLRPPAPAAFHGGRRRRVGKFGKLCRPGKGGSGGGGATWSPEVLLRLSGSGLGDARGSLVLAGKGCWELGSS